MENIQKEKSRCFIAEVRVQLDQFRREGNTIHGFRNGTERNVEGLIEEFRKDRCRRDIYPVEAIVSRSSYSAAMRTTSTDSGTFLWLENLPAAERPVCLHGKRRIAAGMLFLEDNDRWWLARLYSDDINESARISLRAGDTKASAYCDGDKYRFMRRIPGSIDVKENAWWLREFSPSKRADLKQLYNAAKENEEMRQLVEAWDDLLPFWGLWSSYKGGCQHRGLTMRCPEEQTNYLRLIHWCWTTISGNQPHLIDEVTAEILQGRAPHCSQRDVDFIAKQVRNGTVLPGIVREKERAAALDRLLSLPCRIPSIYTLFEDEKYLEPASKAMRRLLPKRFHGSVRVAFRKRHSGRAPKLDPGEDLSALSSGNGDTDFRAAYLRTWMYAFQIFPEATGIMPRKDLKMPKPVSQEPNPVIWSQLAAAAERSGFESAEIRSLAEKKPGVELCETLLLRKYPGQYNHRPGDLRRDAIEIDEIVERKRLSRVFVPFGSPVVGHNYARDFALGERCNRPHESAFKTTQAHMVISWVYRKDWENQIICEENITAFGVNREIFRAFFGDASDSLRNYRGSTPPTADPSLDTEMSGTEPQSSPETQSDTVMSGTTSMAELQPLPEPTADSRPGVISATVPQASTGTQSDAITAGATCPELQPVLEQTVDVQPYTLVPAIANAIDSQVPVGRVIVQPNQALRVDSQAMALPIDLNVPNIMPGSACQQLATQNMGQEQPSLKQIAAVASSVPEMQSMALVRLGDPNACLPDDPEEPAPRHASVQSDTDMQEAAATMTQSADNSPDDYVWETGHIPLNFDRITPGELLSLFRMSPQKNRPFLLAFPEDSYFILVPRERYRELLNLARHANTWFAVAFNGSNALISPRQIVDSHETVEALFINYSPFEVREAQDHNL